MQALKFVIALCTASTLLAGCATSRSVVAPKIETSINPTQGTAVRIVKVEDQRGFRIAPATPDIPSLSDNAIDNKAITERAVARKRNGYGMALGDVLLPQPNTVANMMQGAIEQGLRDAGYRVIAKDQPGYDEALPVNAVIKQCWAWMTPGFWSITLEHRAEVVLQAPLKAFENGTTIQGYVKDSRQIAGDGAWTEIVSKGFADVTGKVKAKLVGL